MAWVVDTSVLLDIRLADPSLARSSAECLAAHVTQGLTLSPVSYVELAPAFASDTMLQEMFLAEIGIDWPSSWTIQDTKIAHELWAARIAQKRTGHLPRRPIADVLIEAFARRFQGLITRNPQHFQTVQVVVP